MPYVIACGDEGVQLNEGTRLGILGAGFRLDGITDVVAILKKLFPEDIRIVANEENAWVKDQLNLSNWEQVTASTQQQVQALADREGLLYAGFLPFADPKNLDHGVRGHMVRPQGIHIATKICFTLGGGEQKYNLGNYVISADWVAEAKPELVKAFIQTQVDFYTKLNGGELPMFVFEEAGVLGEAVAAKNREALTKAGFSA